MNIFTRYEYNYTAIGPVVYEIHVITIRFCFIVELHEYGISNYCIFN